MKHLTFLNLTDSPTWKPRSESLTRCTRGKGPDGSIWDVWAYGHCELHQQCEIAGKAKPHHRETVSVKDVDFTTHSDGENVERRYIILLPDQKSLDAEDFNLIETGLSKILCAICAPTRNIDYRIFKQRVGKTNTGYSNFLLDDLGIYLRITVDSFRTVGTSPPVSYDTEIARTIIQLTTPSGMKSVGTYRGDRVLRYTPGDSCAILEFEKELFGKIADASSDELSFPIASDGPKPAPGEVKRIDERPMPADYRGALVRVRTNASSGKELTSRMSEQLMPTVIIFDNGNPMLMQALRSWAKDIVAGHDSDPSNKAFEGRESIIHTFFSRRKARN